MIFARPALPERKDGAISCTRTIFTTIFAAPISSITYVTTATSLAASEKMIFADISTLILLDSKIDSSEPVVRFDEDCSEAAVAKESASAVEELCLDMPMETSL